MSFPRYEKYKDSGVEWLGEVPAHWDAMPIKRLASLQSGDSITAESIEEAGDFPVYGGNGLRGYASEFTHEGEYALIGRQGALCGNVNYATGQFWASEHAVVVSPTRPLIMKWIGEVLRVMNLNQYSVSAAQPGLSVDMVSRLAIPVPPLSEQQDIATFLQYETAKIDALVEEQRRLIELLKEKRKAVISQTVTKGLKPGVAMKASGVEWLGKVPVHWEVMPLKWLIQPDRPIMYGIVLPGPDVGDGVPILKGGNVKPSRLRLEALARTTPEIEAPYARARLRQGDLVYSIRGTIGDCELVPAELDGCNITQDVARIAPAEGFDAEWLRFALLSDAVAEDLACGSLGAAVRGINIYDLKRATLPVPPKSERAEIARALTAAVREFEQLMEAAERAMTLLRERRSALISAVVTGKIDVRSLSPQPEAIAA